MLKIYIWDVSLLRTRHRIPHTLIKGLYVYLHLNKSSLFSPNTDIFRPKGQSDENRSYNKQHFIFSRLEVNVTLGKLQNTRPRQSPWRIKFTLKCKFQIQFQILGDVNKGLAYKSLLLPEVYLVCSAT